MDDLTAQHTYPLSAWHRRPFHIMAKPIGSLCNMRCDYCYYLQKKFPKNAGRGDKKPQGVSLMSEETLCAYIRQYIEAQPLGEPVVFTWHGGEALLRPISFYKKALVLQQTYAGGRQIENCIQTNGLLMSEAWCAFFREHNFLVGISLDGTEEQHDRYRRTIKDGATFARVLRAIELMQRMGVEYNILSTINRYNADEPLDYYRFLRGIGSKFIQFTPIVERIAEGAAAYEQVEAPYIHEEVARRELHHSSSVSLAPYSVLPEQWGDFLIGVFDEWVRADVGEVFVQMFDATLAGWMGVSPGVCTLAKECGHAGVIEHTGDVYSCDHYVYPRYYLGNIHELSLASMMNSPEQLRFGRAKHAGLTEQCKACLYLTACHGECPKNRFGVSSSGEPGHNYLCAGYYRFWAHAAPYMDYMKACLMRGEPAARVMDQIERLRAQQS